ncbi:hypothetical protein Nepgr_003082 [Nepenthes gracilis]|uniref:BCNT-C domain-containing protein n=1 Tax=Nepenthes gracilis TaxID=150966 RepID=A0AAD3XCW6_NEPGR|nr:hypothetical protein Nepgr_003082 [Nepenthes gracilis]
MSQSGEISFFIYMYLSFRVRIFRLLILASAAHCSSCDALLISLVWCGVVLEPADQWKFCYVIDQHICARIRTTVSYSVMQQMDDPPTESMQEAAPLPTSKSESKDSEMKARVDAVWQQMNKGVSANTLKSFSKKANPTVNKTLENDKASHKWMTLLNLAPKKAEPNGETMLDKRPNIVQNANSDDAKKIAAAALSAVRDAAASAPLFQGKIEITEVRDFAGQEIEYRKLVDPDSKEATEREKASVVQSSAVDAVLEQIKKKPKLSVLDKTKKDWGEFKQENKGLEEELDSHKKSSNQYLERVSFLERTEHREFERERDARLAVQAKRRPDMLEEP